MVVTTARKQVVSLKRSYPCYTLQAIGDKVGVSRERVRQILKSAGEHTKAWRPKRLCANCGKKLIHRYHPANDRKERFCSKECYSQYHHITLECELCHKFFRRVISEILHYDDASHRYNHTFCSRQCFGRWLGLHYGRGRPKGGKNNAW